MELVYCKDLQEEQQLQWISGSNNYKQYQIILQTKEGPDLLVESNVSTDIVSKSPLLNHKDIADTIKESNYSLKEIQFIQWGQICCSESIHLVAFPT